MQVFAGADSTTVPLFFDLKPVRVLAPPSCTKSLQKNYSQKRETRFFLFGPMAKRVLVAPNAIGGKKDPTLFFSTPRVVVAQLGLRFLVKRRSTLQNI